MNFFIYLNFLVDSIQDSNNNDNIKKIVYEEANLKAAITSVIEKRMSYREASAYFNVTKSTLQRKVKLILNGEQVNFKSNWGNYKPTFNEAQAEQLYKYLKLLEQRRILLTKQEFLSLAYEFAIKMKIKHRFSDEKRMAGERFYRHFIKRYSCLNFSKTSCLKNQNAPFERNIDSLVEEFIKLLANHIFDPIYIFNETCMSDQSGNITRIY